VGIAREIIPLKIVQQSVKPVFQNLIQTLSVLFDANYAKSDTRLQIAQQDVPFISNMLI
jgi:hypothetical protein